MALTHETVRRIALRTLGRTDSFIAAQRMSNKVPAGFAAADSGTVVGVYINDKDNHLIITERGVTVVAGERQNFIGFACITQITSPDDVDQDIDLLVENDRFDDVRSYSIPVLGATEDLPDIIVFHEFLLGIMEYLQINPINLRSVSSKQDLIDYLKTECEWEEYTGALANYLEKDFGTWAFEDLKIDEEMLRKPDFWRAVAVILNVPMRQPVQKVRDPDGWANTAEFRKET
jgi:hypothetical protein